MNEFITHHIESDHRVGSKFMQFVQLEPIAPEAPLALRIGVPASALDIAEKTGANPSF